MLRIALREVAEVAPLEETTLELSLLAEICLRGLVKGEPGDVYTVSDGTPRHWSEIIDVAAKRWGVPKPECSDNSFPGKKMSNRKVVEDFSYRLRYPDLYAALDEIELDQEQKGKKGTVPR